MPITWRPAAEHDIEPCLAIRPGDRGDALVGPEACLRCWRRLVQDPFFFSSVFEASPAIQGHRVLGFGAAVIVNPKFADSELAHPRPDIVSRVLASFDSDSPALATRAEIAQANAGVGVDVIVIHNARRDSILSPAERRDVELLSVTGFAENLAGYRIHRIVAETTSKFVQEFLARSPEYRFVAAFPHCDRSIYLMNEESATALAGSIGNVIFSRRQPVLRLRDSDRQLLLAALKGVTDPELAAELGITFAAVKARWRSTFARIAEGIPGLANGVEDRAGRGNQKRHRVLAYLRTHMEELRPYDWRASARQHKSLAIGKSARSI